MSFLKNLAKRLFSSSSNLSSEPGKMAALLIAELKLYNERAVSDSRKQNTLTPALDQEIERAYSIFADRVGVSEEAKSAFRAEAARGLFPGRVELLQPVFAKLEAPIPPATTSR